MGERETKRESPSTAPVHLTGGLKEGNLRKPGEGVGEGDPDRRRPKTLNSHTAYRDPNLTPWGFRQGSETGRTPVTEGRGQRRGRGRGGRGGFRLPHDRPPGVPDRKDVPTTHEATHTHQDEHSTSTGRSGEVKRGLVISFYVVTRSPLDPHAAHTSPGPVNTLPLVTLGRCAEAGDGGLGDEGVCSKVDRFLKDRGGGFRGCSPSHRPVETVGSPH